MEIYLFCVVTLSVRVIDGEGLAGQVVPRGLHLLGLEPWRLDGAGAVDRWGWSSGEGGLELWEGLEHPAGRCGLQPPAEATPDIPVFAPKITGRPECRNSPATRTHQDITGSLDAKHMGFH